MTGKGRRGGGDVEAGCEGRRGKWVEREGWVGAEGTVTNMDWDGACGRSDGGKGQVERGWAGRLAGSHPCRACDQPTTPRHTRRRRPTGS